MFSINYLFTDENYENSFKVKTKIVEWEKVKQEIKPIKVWKWRRKKSFVLIGIDNFGNKSYLDLETMEELVKKEKAEL